MRTILSVAVLLLLAIFSADAQYLFQDAKNPDTMRSANYDTSPLRNEIIIPQVNGYNVIKADLHVHTMFSDADATPEWRVVEAWCDGLDVIAITDHIEYRPYEQKMAESMPGYIEASDVAKFSKSNPKSDLNFPVKMAQERAKVYGITIIPGTEITRDGKTIGHFNALFTTDNNKIYDKDPLQAIRNAKAQGAIVQHNHPGWSRTSTDYTEVEAAAYDAGLIDGIEVINGAASGEFYPKMVSRAIERGMYVSGDTDIHRMTANDYTQKGGTRAMTLIFAEDNSLESVRAALEAKRTLAYGFGCVAGPEHLLKDLCQACLAAKFVRIDSNGRPVMRLTNISSIPFVVRVPGSNPICLTPFTSSDFKCKTAESKSLSVVIDNMWCGEAEHPTITFVL